MFFFITLTKYEEICAVIKEVANNPLENILNYTDDKVVSTDLIGTTHSLVFYAKTSISLEENFIKLLAPYIFIYLALCFVKNNDLMIRYDNELPNDVRKISASFSSNKMERDETI